MFHHRCYYVAESFIKMEKWAEALVLYERTLAHIKAARKSKIQVRKLIFPLNPCSTPFPPLPSPLPFSPHKFKILYDFHVLCKKKKR